jgi:hypothetical protein
MDGHDREARAVLVAAAPGETPRERGRTQVPERVDEVGSKPHSVQVRNVTRQSVVFQVPGRSVHVRPGGTVDLPNAFLESREAALLLHQGALVRVSAAAPAPTAPPGPVPAAAGRAAAPGEEAASGEKSVRRGRK